jgi:Dockerin type I domain
VNRSLSVVLVAAVLALAAGAAAQVGPVPRFFGPVNQDGCEFCCEFRCQRTPTPTPEYDGLGRRVFRRHEGTFLLVAEAGLGTSRRLPGSEGVFTGRVVDPISDPSDRPSLWALPDHDLGNGTLGVDCRTFPLGGVKGFPGRLNFPMAADVTTGLKDMACRFEMASSSATACTRNRYGDFSFLAPGTSRQYCFQVSEVAKFPLGPTVLSLLVRDTDGNLGPRQEIVVIVDPSGRQQAATPTPSPTRTPASASVAGRIRYYSADRPVPNAFVQLSGGVMRSTMGAGTGTYAFANLTPGDAVIEPRKTGDFGTPTSITALDASWVLQYVAGQRPFNADQRLAADVTGNGTVSALDGTRILQRQVGMLPRLEVANRCNSDWIFRPLPGAAPNQRLIQPQTTGGVCRKGAIALEPLAGAAVQQDFLGILFGDVTGNWQPSAGFGAALRGLVAGPHTLRVRSARPAGGGMLRLPLAIKGDEPYYSLDITITYDSDLLTPSSVRKLRAARDALAVFNLARPGVVRIAVASAEPMPFGQSVIALDFLGTAPSDAIRVARAMVDDLPAAISD